MNKKLKCYFKEGTECWERMMDLAQDAMHHHRAVAPEWYELDKKLEKIARNYRAYCRRHNLTDMPHNPW